jgi:hypothetical protein
MPFEIARNIDDSFDVLMNNKTDLTRVLFEERLSNFGIAVVEFQLTDVLRRPDIVKRIATNLRARRYPDQDVEEPVADTLDAGFEYTQIEQRIFNDLNKVGLYPTREEIRTLIEAGRALVRDRLSELDKKYRELQKRRFHQDCRKVITPETSYCWPKIFEGADLLSTSTGILLKNYMLVTEDFLKTSTETRLQYIKYFQERNRSLYLKGIKEFLDVDMDQLNQSEILMDQDRRYYELIGKPELANDIDHFKICFAREVKVHKAKVARFAKNALKQTEGTLCGSHSKYCDDERRRFRESVEKLCAGEKYRQNRPMQPSKSQRFSPEPLRHLCHPSLRPATQIGPSPWYFLILAELAAAADDPESAMNWLSCG